MNAPLLLSLQQLPVSTNLHIQSQLDVQELLVLVQLLLHLLPHLGHFSLLLPQQATGGVPLPRQGVLQVPHLRLAGRQLDHIEGHCQGKIRVSKHHRSPTRGADHRQLTDNHTQYNYNKNIDIILGEDEGSVAC